MKKILFFILLTGFIACKNEDKNDPLKPQANAPKSMSYSIINTYPHDTSSYTEGLLIYKGDLYESSGNYGFSKLKKVDLKTGKSLKAIPLESKYFGEGIVIINDTIYQLTYKEKVGFMYSLKDFKKLGEFKFASDEGWGMTSDGINIIASDGSSNLYYYQPGTLKLLKTQAVTEAGSFSFNLNELEYIDGYIYANQWQSGYILKIDPATGQIAAKADLTKVWDRVKTLYKNAEVPNGIAYDAATKKIYVTGKFWPELYEIQFSQ